MMRNYSLHSLYYNIKIGPIAIVPIRPITHSVTPNSYGSLSASIPQYCTRTQVIHVRCKYYEKFIFYNELTELFKIYLCPT